MERGKDKVGDGDPTQLMANLDSSGLMVVRCPHCHSILWEPHFPALDFECGGCGTILRGHSYHWLHEAFNINNTSKEAGHDITTNVSRKKSIDCGGMFGTIYKGVAANGEEFTVKSTRSVFIEEVRNTKIQTELCNLTLLRHTNFVRLATTFPKEQTLTYFCYEYLQNATDHELYLSDLSNQLDWQTCYGIIRGTCEALAYLHPNKNEPFYQLRLSPRCIMLGKNMVPKLQYVSFSKYICPVMTGKRDRSRSINAKTGKLDRGKPGYLIQSDIVSQQHDVFSLGVIMINILTGTLLEYETIDMTPQEIIYSTRKKWKEILQKTYSGVSLELYCQQVKTCTEIALSCVKMDMNKRPNAAEIIKRLIETEKLEIDPLNRILQRLQELPVSEESISRADGISMQLDILERGWEPSNLKLPLLQLITDNFSDELKLGHGGCGAVYKGILRHGIIAVKKLFNSYTIDDKMFHQEVTSMMMVRHQNIVRLLGYCSHTEERAVEIMAGKFVMAEERKRLLCFEYISNGSLADHIKDELRGPEWNTRYQIIKGICDGLHHLHVDKHLIHMDLKPANILLDESMTPKITDFGVSRLDDKTHTLSAERLLSMGYCAPEYMHDGKMSAKSDIYSLGVIILEIITGNKEKRSAGKVLKRWKHRWNKASTDMLLAYKQVSKCLDLVQRCMHHDPTHRPSIWDIVNDLKRTTDSSEEDMREATEYHKLEGMLAIEPLEMHLSIELNKQMSFFIELTNNTDGYFAFRISTTSLRPYHIHPTKDIVAPDSKCFVTVTLQLERAPSSHDRCKDEFTVETTMVDGSLTITDISDGLFNEDKGNVVDNVDLTVVLTHHVGCQQWM